MLQYASGVHEASTIHCYNYHNNDHPAKTARHARTMKTTSYSATATSRAMADPKTRTAGAISQPLSPQ